MCGTMKFTEVKIFYDLSYHCLCCDLEYIIVLLLTIQKGDGDCFQYHNHLWMLCLLVCLITFSIQTEIYRQLFDGLP